mgnify:CR=1 FL=1
MSKQPLKLYLLKPMAWLVLFWEAFWTAFWPLFVFLGFVFALAFTPISDFLPPYWHLGILAFLSFTFIVLLGLGIWKIRLPKWLQASRRLEEDSGFLHQPLSGMKEEANFITTDPDDPSAALWNAHQEQQRKQLKKTKIKAPRGLLLTLDRYGIRLLPLLAIAIVAPLNWLNLERNVKSNLWPTWPTPPAPLALQIDAWITPPTYTAIDPFVVDFSKTGQHQLHVPTKSELVLQLQGGTDGVEVRDGQGAIDATKVSSGAIRIKMALQNDKTIQVLKTGAEKAALSFSIKPDLKPAIILEERPRSTDRGSLQLKYRAEDDYGLAKITAQLELAEGPKQNPATLLLTNFNELETLVQKSDFLSLAEHLWAGSPVFISLIAEDIIGQVKESSPAHVQLPERQFRNPLAKKVIEIRKQLYFRSQDRFLLAQTLLNMAQELGASEDNRRIDIQLLQIGTKLKSFTETKVPDTFYKELWDIALALDFSPLSDAETRLKEAEENLRDALENSAPESEVEQRVQELRKAMEDFMSEMARQSLEDMLNNQNLDLAPLDQNSPTSSALDQLSDELKNLTEQGAREEALELLNRMKEMLENLQSNDLKMSLNQSPNDGSNAGMMQQLGEIMEDQQSLLNELFSAMQAGTDWNDTSDANLDSALKQEKIRQALGDLMRDTARGLGGIPKPLGEAERKMKSAVEALRGARGEEAVESQTQALRSLQDSAQEIANIIAQQMGDGAPSQAMEGLQSRNGQGPLDPLGRKTKDGRTGKDDLLGNDPSLAGSQSDAIVKELRKRLTQPGIKPKERAYIQKLLEKF